MIHCDKDPGNLMLKQKEGGLLKALQRSKEATGRK